MDGNPGSKWMYVGKIHAGQTYVDALGRCNRQVVINEDGYGEFSVHGKSVSVWIPRL